MKAIFDGHQPAVNFAQTESGKLNKKLYVFLIRDNGVQYAVVDDAGKATMIGKCMSEYGRNPIPPTPVAPPTPKPEVKKEEKVEPVAQPKKEGNE